MCARSVAPAPRTSASGPHRWRKAKTSEVESQRQSRRQKSKPRQVRQVEEEGQVKAHRRRRRRNARAKPSGKKSTAKVVAQAQCARRRRPPADRYARNNGSAWPRSLRIALAQLDLLVGDVRGNAARVRETAQRARRMGADLVVFPELTLSGYPPEDLLFHRGLRIQVEQALEGLRAMSTIRNRACPHCSSAIRSTRALRTRRHLQRGPPAGAGQPPVNYRKQMPAELPRLRREALFHAGQRVRRSWSSPACASGLTICEDVWEAAARPRRARGWRGGAPHPSTPRPTSSASSASARPCCGSAWTKPAFRWST